MESSPSPNDRRPPAPELAEQIVELSALTGGLAHEIRNPLSTLKVNLQLLDEDWRRVEEPPDGQPVDPLDVARRGRKRLAVLLNESNRLERILEDFLQYVGRRELNIAPVNVTQLIGELSDFYGPQALAHRIEFVVEAPPEPLVCPLDAAAFKQALLNLLINAQQAMPDGGRLTLRLGPEGVSAVRIDVIDDGPGVPESLREKIFEAYYSTKHGGTGLGLATTRRIIRRHGGQIDVEPAPTGGSRFVIQLPRTTAKNG